MTARGPGPCSAAPWSTCGPASWPTGRGCALSSMACAGFPRRDAWSWPARTRRLPSAGRTGSGRWTRGPLAAGRACPNCWQARSGCSGWRTASSAGSIPTRRGSGAFTCTTGTGRGGWPRTRTGWPPGRCSPVLWRSWQASAGFGRGDAWHPYPAALRAWSWCGLHRDSRGRQRHRAGIHRRAGGSRGIPAPSPGVRRRRQPPDQGAQGPGRPGRLLRRRAAAPAGAAAAGQAAGHGRCWPTAATTSARPPITARCWPTSSTWRTCCGPRDRPRPAS